MRAGRQAEAQWNSDLGRRILLDRLPVHHTLNPDQQLLVDELAVTVYANSPGTPGRPGALLYSLIFRAGLQAGGPGRMHCTL